MSVKIKDCAWYLPSKSGRQISPFSYLPSNAFYLYPSRVINSEFMVTDALNETINNFEWLIYFC